MPNGEEDLTALTDGPTVGEEWRSEAVVESSLRVVMVLRD